jgi:signal transduction histidine kinase
VYFLYSQNEQIKSINHSFAFLLMFITVVLFFILYMLYRFKKFKISLLQKTIDIKKILDNQEAIVVVTDRKDIKEANQKFFDFVGLKNIQEFKNNHLCICEFFEYEEGENYIQAQMDTLLWNEYLLQYKDEIHYVKMSGIDKVKHIFQISISDFEEYQIINFYDITKQKELEKQLNDMNKNLEIHIADEIEKSRKKDIVIQQQIRLAQMGEMISMIAHQWRQPLASISSSIVTVKLKFILKKYDLESNEGKELFLAYLNSELDDIESVVEGLTTTIDNFRNFYKTTDEIEEVYIDDILQKAVGSINIEYSNGDLDIVESYHSKKIISVYKNEIFQVLFNILINSIENFNEKYIEHRLIKIESEDLDGIIQIKITDNGGGIPMDIIDKIFDPYFSTKNNKNDTGLGLYTSKITIERNHRGKLTVQNTSDGVCFCITLHL